MKELNSHPGDWMLSTGTWGDDFGRTISENLKICRTSFSFDANGLPFIPYFEKKMQAKLTSAGFKEEVLVTPRKLKFLIDQLEKQGFEFVHPWPGHSFPESTYEIDGTTFWVKPEIEAALRALAAIGRLKELLRDNAAIEVYLQTLDMLSNLMRSGNLVQQGIGRIQGEKASEDSRQIKQLVLRRAILNVFDKYPKVPKTAEGIWPKYNLANKDVPLTDRKTAEVYFTETGANRKGERILIIKRQGKKPLTYKFDSLRTHIDWVKKHLPTMRNSAIAQ